MVFLCHVHPAGFLGYSSVDYLFFESYTAAFGPVRFSSITFDNDNLSSTLYREIQYSFIQGKVVEIGSVNRNRTDRLHDYTNFPSLSSEDLVVLKALSYSFYASPANGNSL